MSKQKKLIGFIALEIAMFIGTLDSTIINIALPDIMNYFKASLNDTSWISTIYVLGLSVCMIPASKFADQFGRKKVMLIGLVLFGASSALCGLSGSLFFLISMRLFQGIGGALITPIVIPMALELYGREKTQTVAGAIGGVTALAAAGGPPIGGLLIKYINWQTIFYVNVPLALISFILTIFFIRESYDDTVSKSIDWLGMLFLTAFLFPLTFSLLKGRDYGWSSSLIISLLIGSGVSLILFILTELKVTAPLVELGLFREITFTASSICYLITGFGIVSPLLIFNYFLQNARGYDALSAAYIVMAVSLTVIISMPLGSMIAGMIGARLVNFCGVLCMAGGALMLSKITFDTSKPMMILIMIVFGVGLGFSCQSLVSSIKHLPEEKSGIGSGIVNAARQIGTCIGIALLVSVLNSNVSDVKNIIKSDAADAVSQSDIVSSVKTVMLKDINESYSSDNSTVKEQKKLQSRLKKDVKDALLSAASLPEPSGEDTISTIYNGVVRMSSAEGKVIDGQQSIFGGIGKLSTGLDKLASADEKITDRLSRLNRGISKTHTGALALSTASKEGINSFSTGVGKLDEGVQKLLTQFSSGSSGTLTIYDGVTAVEKGNKNLSSNLVSYITAADNTYYLMIKTNPSSSLLLAGYKDSLGKAQKAYAGTKDKTAKEQYKQQILALNNLIALYTAGTDSSVTNEKQFEEKLINLASKNKDSLNVVAAESKITSGSKQLVNASEKVSAQFKDDGTFKAGMEKLAGGISRLNNSKKDLVKLQGGMDRLTDATIQLKSGSDKLTKGSEKLGNHLKSAEGSCNKLLSGSEKLKDADTKIEKGMVKLESGLSLAGQKSKISDVMKKIKSEKNDKIANAFDKTFLLSSMILAAASIFGLFTDRRNTLKVKK